jgi:hypothetical protein
MFDDLNTPDDRTTPDAGYPTRGELPHGGIPRGSEGTEPTVLPDREVPLPGAAPSLLHQWLDGDVSIAIFRATPGGNEAVDLWNKIHDEAETLRSRTTPLYVHKRIMDALPDDKYHVDRPWYRRPIPMNPAVLVIAAVVLIALGAIVARAVLR